MLLIRQFEISCYFFLDSTAQVLIKDPDDKCIFFLKTKYLRAEIFKSPKYLISKFKRFCRNIKFKKTYFLN